MGGNLVAVGGRGEKRMEATRLVRQRYALVDRLGNKAGRLGFANGRDQHLL